MLEDLKSQAENLMSKAGELASNPKVKEMKDKAEEFLKSEEGKKKLNDIKEKAEDFVSEKTDGKGILGFGKK